MNKKTRKIVYAHHRDSRSSTRQIGKFSRSSQQTASYIISNLVYKKHIQNYQVLLDPAKFGLLNILVFYTYTRLDKAKINLIKQLLKKNPYTTLVEELGQGVDLVAQYTVPNLSLFNKQHRDLLHQIRDSLKVAQQYVVIVKHRFDLKYFVQRAFVDDIILCGDREIYLPNKKETLVLKELFKNPRSSFLAIGKAVDIDPKTAKKMIQHFADNHILKGFSLVLNHQAFNISRYYLFLNLENSDTDELDKFVEYCLQHKNVVEIVKLIGEFELLVVTEQFDPHKNILDDFRKEFLVKDYRIMQSQGIIKSQTVPDYLFE